MHGNHGYGNKTVIKKETQQSDRNMMINIFYTWGYGFDRISEFNSKVFIMDTVQT